MIKYDENVTTIIDILNALDKFENKEEIVEAIKTSLFDIETDWHTEEMLRRENSQLMKTLNKLEGKE